MSGIRLLAGTREKGESSKAVQACNDYLRLGPGRSLNNLLASYDENECNRTAPTTSKGTLANWSTRYGWQTRAETYDTRIEAQKTARAEEIMQSGLALVHNRIEKLAHVFDLLEAQLYQRDAETDTLSNLWLHDVKAIGGGETVDITHFNAALIRELRATLEDIASEVGGRIKKHELGGTAGAPIKIQIVLDE